MSCQSHRLIIIIIIIITIIIITIFIISEWKTKKRRKEDKAKELLHVNSYIIDTSYIPTVLFKGK